MGAEQRSSPHHIGETLTATQLAPALFRQLRVVPPVGYISHILRTGRVEPRGLKAEELAKVQDQVTGAVSRAQGEFGDLMRKGLKGLKKPDWMS